VAALLCGVFFAVGYVVGGNSAKATLVADGSAATSEGKHEEPAPTTASTQVATQAAPPPVTPSVTGDSAGTVPAAEPMVRDNPVATGAQPPSVQSAPAPAQSMPAPKPAAQEVPVVKPTAPAAKSAATGVFISVPEAGSSYWQVIAVERPAADELVKTLREGKLPAILATSSQPSLFRVLVGPYRSPMTLSEAKRKLTELGYNAPMVQKY
jgi:cell division septation protein DedD